MPQHLIAIVDGVSRAKYLEAKQARRLEADGLLCFSSELSKPYQDVYLLGDDAVQCACCRLPFRPTDENFPTTCGPCAAIVVNLHGQGHHAQAHKDPVPAL